MPALRGQGRSPFPPAGLTMVRDAHAGRSGLRTPTRPRAPRVIRPCLCEAPSLARSGPEIGEVDSTGPGQRRVNRHARKDTNGLEPTALNAAGFSALPSLQEPARVLLIPGARGQ